MKHFTKSFLVLFAALFSFSMAFAETGTETEANQKNGNKNTTAEGQSYTIDGAYIAGTGSKQAPPMTSKGLKFRTAVNGNTLEFTVRENYTITKLYIAAIGNYEADDNTIPYVKVSKVEVDGTEVDFDGGEFPDKNASEASELTVDNIEAKEKIVLYFDNSNASAGTQLNASWIINWERPDATQPTITVTPKTLALVPGASSKLSVHVDPASFTTQWVSSDESVATVNEEGVVTAVAPGTATISHQWADNATVADGVVVTVAEFNPSVYTVNTYDFTAMGDVSLTMGEKAGAIWNEANNKPNDVFFCTNTGLENIAIQAAADKDGKGWSIADGGGLYLGKGAGRCAAVCNLLKGQIVEIIYTGEGFYTGSKDDAVRKDDGAPKSALNEGVGRAIYRMENGGMLGFEIVKANAVQKINIYSSPLIEAKAAFEEIINMVKGSALAGKLASAIAEAETALNADDATVASIAAAAQKLENAIKTAATSLLQTAVSLAGMLQSDDLADELAAAAAVLAKEDASAEELLTTLQALVTATQPVAQDILDLAAEFANKYGYSTLLTPIANAKAAVESGDIEAIQTAILTLGFTALPSVKDALTKVNGYAETIADVIDNTDLVDAIAKAQADLASNDFMSLISDMQDIATKFQAAAAAFIISIQAMDTEGKALADELNAALATAIAAMSAENPNIVTIGEAIKNLVKAYRAFIEANITDGINTISKTVENTVIFDMQGRRVVNAQKGLFIINGKKVLR